MNVICFHNPDEENGYLSNWYLSHFTVKGIDFFVSGAVYDVSESMPLSWWKNSVMTYFIQIDVAEIKKLGRKVHNYDENV